jgi:hypothetical protein
LRGVALAREKGLLLTWDEHGHLYLLNRRGERQAHRPLGFPVTRASIADDGSACAALGPRGEIAWLAPDLTIRWQKTLAYPVIACGLDPFAQYLAVTDNRGKWHVLDGHGHRVLQAECPRPLHHLAFVPAAPLLVGCADFGLVACFDFAGQCVWRVGLVAHVGSLAVNGDGSLLTLACYTEGLQRYDRAGQSLGRWNAGEPCRLAALTYDGAWTLAAGLSKRLLLLDATGQVATSHTLEQPAVDLALAALGDAAYVAHADGRLVGFELREAAR